MWYLCVLYEVTAGIPRNTNGVCLCYVKSIAKMQLDVKKPFILELNVIRYGKYNDLKR